jgi:lysophospholipase L1-like esterase
MMTARAALAFAALASCACSNKEAASGGDGPGTGGAGVAGHGGSAPDGGGGGGSGAGAELPAPAWAWVGIVGTGQSLSVGATGTPELSTTQRYNNLKLALGGAVVPPFDPADARLSVEPLKEPLRPRATTYPSAYPRNLNGETPHTAMAGQVTALYRAAGGADYVTAHTVVGESGQGMSVIEKGATDTGGTGRAYEATLFEVAALKRLAEAAGKTYGVGAVIITHGETDASNTSYGSELRRLQTDYDADLRALTGQTAGIPMLVTQQHSVPDAVGSRSASTLAQWRVGLDHPGELVCVGPKYQYAYSADAVHLTAAGYVALGEKYGQVFFERVVMGRDWQPLQPKGVSRSGNVLTVTFHVPVGPLAWDTAMPEPHATGLTEWSKGRGFEVVAGTTRQTIESVAIIDDTVKITCASLPDGGISVRYAATAQGDPRPGGPRRWGLLRDSDPFVGDASGSAQPNYCVAFELAVP